MADEDILVGACPFELFPQELWEMILERIEDSHDILKITQIYPQLKGLSHGNEFSWLIGEVMPFILPKFLNFQHDIKSCRLVSKRWRNAIETTHETHPERVPYNHPKTGKVTEHHISYHPLPQFKINLQRFIETGMTHECKHDHNPFPGHSLKVKIVLPQKLSLCPSVNVSMLQVVQILQRFGHHIFYVRFVPYQRGKWNINIFVQDYINNVMKCLVYLPNLRSLTLEGLRLPKFNEIPDTNEVSIESVAPIPVLSKLEMLDLSLNLCEINKALFCHILTCLVKGGKIKMLGIYQQYWDIGYMEMFPNLTELRINGGSRQYGEGAISTILEELRSPNLRKLSLRFDWLDIRNLAKILVPFQIETLELCCFNLHESDTYDQIVPSIKHVKFIALPSMDLLFLKMFPCLENLTINYDDDDSDGWEEEDGFWDEINNFTRGIRHYLLDFKTNLSQRDIVWESFPKLNIITVYGNPIRYYSRETPYIVYKALNSNPVAISGH